MRGSGSSLRSRMHVIDNGQGAAGKPTRECIVVSSEVPRGASFNLRPMESASVLWCKRLLSSAFVQNICTRFGGLSHVAECAIP